MLLLPYMELYFNNKLKLFIEGHNVITNLRLLDVHINIPVDYNDKFCTAKYNYLTYMGMFYKYLHPFIYTSPLSKHKYISKT